MSPSGSVGGSQDGPDPGLGHLNLRGWPFSVVPSRDQARIWVGREEVRLKLVGLLRTVRRVETSRIVLLWADYGQGKTHVLRHVVSLVEDDEQVHALHVVTPKGIRSFVDVYRAIIDAALNDGVIDELGLKVFEHHGADAPTNLQRALVRLVTFEESQTRAALSWLKAEKVDLRSLREFGVGRRIETSADGIEMLNELVGLLSSEMGVKLVLLLDEIQELGELSPQRLDEAVGGLHKVFDRNTEGLTLVFSFTTGQQETIKRIIGETLYERRSETLTLRSLGETEATEFVVGLIGEWSIEAERVPFPLDEGAVGAVVAALRADSGELTPRELIRAFDAVLRAADLAIEDEEISVVDAEFALKHIPDHDED